MQRPVDRRLALLLSESLKLGASLFFGSADPAGEHDLFCVDNDHRQLGPQDVPTAVGGDRCRRGHRRGAD
jgi:hypothetical protein